MEFRFLTINKGRADWLSPFQTKLQLLYSGICSEHTEQRCCHGDNYP